jgi:hypothetical protein
MSENQTVINYIFYLQHKDELDNSYFLLAEVLSKMNISLLPIFADDLRAMDRAKKYYVISIRNDLASAMSFNSIRKSFLDSAMAGARIVLYDIGSFSEIENAQKLQMKDVYRYYQLPQNLKQVAMTMAIEYFRDRNTMAKWPGGRRAKLPSMTILS